jgi:hypothetical protein
MTTMWAVLISTGILACLFVPFLVARYVTRTIPKRLAEIEAVFSDANSRRVYDLIFAQSVARGLRGGSGAEVRGSRVAVCS